MPTRVINPEYRAHLELGESDVAWTALKAKVTGFLQDQGAKSDVLISDLRDLDPKFRDDRVWNQMMGDLGLMEIPELPPPAITAPAIRAPADPEDPEPSPP